MKIPKLSKKDIISIVLLIIFIVLLSIPNYISRADCEVARPDYKCATVLDVLKENCAYLKNDSFSDADINWYVQQLCPLENKYHSSNLDCSSTQNICQVIMSG